ncbi:Ldh family oxidoreductase [Actibacterium pelagium]|uniref:Ldh family oxidoreductase n=1 Tax=Actibacterium pelagium TaxID=2029103 RepID=UPI0011777BFD|nr:Ldh family oxidoreductase [Actibacterium pelagium]
MERIAECELVGLVGSAFRAAAMRADMADDAARMLVTAEMMGISTHGVSRTGYYVDRMEKGGVNPDATPIITAPAAALRQVDGQNGLGAAVAFRAMTSAMEAAREVGIGAAFCRASSHLGALAPLLLQAAEAGFAAICTTNTAPMIAAPGGRSPILGNQPLGITIPDTGGRHLIFDVALSVAARSKVRQAAAAGIPIPDSWATDAQGQPTTDAAEAMKGFMQAIGGSKGANLSLALDLFTAVLSGSSFLSEIPNANQNPEAVSNTGHLFLVIDAGRLLSPQSASDRLGVARSLLKESAAPDAAHGPRLPGDRALASLAEARAKGVPIAPDLLGRLKALARV